LSRGRLAFKAALWPQLIQPRRHESAGKAIHTRFAEPRLSDWPFDRGHAARRFQIIDWRATDAVDRLHQDHQ
jgi:hypothetical protein